jgi:hypothetical protein
MKLRRAAEYSLLDLRGKMHILEEFKVDSIGNELAKYR